MAKSAAFYAGVKAYEAWRKTGDDKEELIDAEGRLNPYSSGDDCIDFKEGFFAADEARETEEDIDATQLNEAEAREFFEGKPSWEADE